MNTLILKPSELIFDSESQSLKCKDENGLETEIKQFILELHQDEILSLPKNILKTIVKSTKYFNDLRTIFIAHDKRLLTILSRDDILADYLSPYYHEIVKKHRIYSVLPNDTLMKANDLHDDVIKSKNNWLLKPCLLGKGKGIVFGKDCSDEQWLNLCKSSLNENKNEFILQKYIQQELFNYIQANELSFENKYQNVVGTLLCFNEIIFARKEWHKSIVKECRFHESQWKNY